MIKPVAPLILIFGLSSACVDSSENSQMTNKTDPFTNLPLSENLRELHVSFGDTVRIVDAEITRELGIAGFVGTVYGETTPSSSGVEVFGELRTDTAVNVFFEDLDKAYWLAPDLVEFVDHGGGATFEIGGEEWERTEDGQWIRKSKGR
ncbi:MAG: hypothetical protein R3176_06370 [Woeseiaceae bacterium]|nr:hypothetical protein [Woeseiaceae bacterium]